MSFGDFESHSNSLPAARKFTDALNPSATLGSPFGSSSSASASSASAAARAFNSKDDDGSHRKLWDRASHSVFLISNNVATVNKFVSQLGTPRDTPDMRQKLHTLTEETRTMIKQTGADLKQLTITSSSSTSSSTSSSSSSSSTAQPPVSQFEEKQRKLAQQKLQKDFEDVLNRFQTVSKLAAAKSREFVARARAQHAAHEEEENEADNENQPLMGAARRVEQLQVLDNEVEYSEALIQEREEDLRNIEKSIVEVNEIFRDLGTLVHEQQYMLDNIESNIGNVAINMEDATGELRTAAKYQKAAQGRSCCLMIFLGVVIIVVVIVVIN